MQIRLDNILKLNDTVGVGVSGGCDSMCLLHFLCKNAGLYGYSVIAINVEHGIRGENSISDTQFVKDYCKANGIKILTYSVDAIAYAKKNKLSIEQAARILRYQCFEKAISSQACDKIATAHHRDDNVETVLLNLFRGTGLKGLSGIVKERADKIIRPFLSIDRKELEEYAKANGVPYITDESNLSDDYTRNYLRLNVIPKIKKQFPELNKSVSRLAEIVSIDDEYLTQIAEKAVKIENEIASISIPCPRALLSRAIIFALKSMGVKKDWEKAHIDQVIDLTSLNNGAKISLLSGITAIKEYDKIVFYKQTKKCETEQSFKLGESIINGNKVLIEQLEAPKNLKSGLFADLDKIPKTAVLRARKDGDKFTKFGGGTKLLNDYFTDKKIPVRERDEKILIADGDTVLAIFGIAISDKIKVDENTVSIISLS